MSKIFLNNQVLIYLLGESISLILISISAFFSIIILRKWNFNSFSLFQFNLENRAYLISTIVQFLLFIKIALTIYFIYTIDSLSILVPGAMCGAGVISANSYGLNLLFIKLLIIFLLMFYINLNNYDLKAKDYPVIKQKSILVLIIFTLILVEFFLDISYFTNIDLNLPVSCCSALFGQLEGANPLPFGLNITMLLTLFYMLYITLVVANLTNYKWIYLIVSILFLYLSYYAVVYFFGTYVYELPTHKCPFCMMQKEYFYVGYFIWITLFLGSFLAIIYSLIALWLKTELINSKKLSLFLITLFVIINSSYVIVYYLRNGVFL